MSALSFCLTFVISIFFSLEGRHIQYQYRSAASQDEDISVSTEDDEAHVLRKECRKWAIRVAREAKAISEMERRLNVLKLSASRAAINGSRDVSAEQVEAKVEELEHVLRRTRTSKLKDETKISFLRKQLGAQVDKWLDDLPIRKVCLDQK